MTSNQIAYKVAEETERHNKVYEGEDIRHNQETERIAAETNRINEKKVDLEAWYHSEANRINEELGKLNIQMQTALGVEKNRLVEQANKLTATRDENTRYYQQMDAAIRQQSNVLQQARDDEVARHDAATEALSYLNDTTRNWITNKQVEYVNTYNLANVGLRAKELANEVNRTDIQRLLAGYQKMSIENQFILGMQNLNFQQDKLDREMKLRGWETGATYINSVGNLVKGVTPLVLGVMSGPVGAGALTAAQAGKLLFKP